MTIRGPDVVSKFTADLSEFIRGTNLASTHLKKSTKQMTSKVGQFADTMDRQGNRISGTWWKRFGTVALGFTIAYRAMNLFENGLMKLGSTIKESILQSGQLAEQQAKNAFWMTVFAEKSLTFSDAFDIASHAINSIREESVRSISSIDELTTGIDELAQAGLQITRNITPQMVSLVDFTGMVAQTVGSTTRQIRQEFQALMDGTSRVTNQLVRVLTNMGVLTAQNLKDLRNMTNRAEIFEKVVDAIHDRWLAMVDTLIRTSPERAFSYWEKSIQKVLIQSVLLASKLEGVENIFGETLFEAAKRFREEMNKTDMARLVYLMGTLNKGLDLLIRMFNKAVTAVATTVTVIGNLAEELRIVWSVLGDLTIFVLATKAIQILGKMMLWLAVGPAKTVAKAFMLLLSPILLLSAAIAAIGITIIGHVSKNAKVLNALWDDSKESFLSWHDKIKTFFDTTIDYWAEKIRALKDALTTLWREPHVVRMPMPTTGVQITDEQIDKIKDLAKSIVEGIRTPSLKERLIGLWKEQVDGFKEGLSVLQKSTDPYVKKFMKWFDALFKAPEIGKLGDAANEVNVAFKKMLSPIVLEDLKKMEREMKKFGDEIPAFVTSLDALKKGLITPEDLTEFTKSEKILGSYNRMMRALTAQMRLAPEDTKRRAEYEELVAIVEKWKSLALAHNTAQYALKRYQDQLRLLEDIQDDYNQLVMTGREYELWALDESLKKMKALAVGNVELTNMLNKYTEARVNAIRSEFDGLTKLAGDVAQSMENSFSDLFFDVMTANWEDLGNLTENTLRAMQRALSDFFAQALKGYLIGEQMGSGAYTGGFLKGLFGWLLGGTLGGKGGGSPEVYPFSYAHQGWDVGKENVPVRMMPISLLENAVRLHGGLRSNEYPAILESGERVLARGEGSIGSVTIINKTNFTPEVSEKRRPGGGKDINIIIGEMVAKDIYQGGPLKQAMKATYGLQPQTVRR